ncbi:deoxyribodipyrimidine photo-lyase [Azotosporobacter soli]|uniref:deoxyribodipyrimidine photo-lyase n=1 Tax=Azotosporobacter soli TaxID=3055040 RepID=UPI0031FEF90E
MHPLRMHHYKASPNGAGPVVYWMSRDQRALDNWALLAAQELALVSGTPLYVVFCLDASFADAPLRHFDFMLRGLEETAATLLAHNIPFYLLKGDPSDLLPHWLREHKAAHLIFDFDPLSLKRRWQAEVMQRSDIACSIVDAHNIVPCWQASDKREYAARTLRPKLMRQLAQFLEPYPPLRIQPDPYPADCPPFSAADTLTRLRPQLDASVAPVDWLTPGTSAALRVMDYFLQQVLAQYDKARNDPTQDGQSNLSPYLHFGQLSAQTVVKRLLAAPQLDAAHETALEQFFIRRELSDNFCFYTPDYASCSAFPAWAQASHARESRTPRPYLYTAAQFEAGATHDEYWNAAQQELVSSGKMHGYLRMYWAKKILEWSDSAETALAIAIHLNDRYSLDGRDPNGYAGIAWSIGGVHDRPWFKQPVFGSIRSMSTRGLAKKFALAQYRSTFAPQKAAWPPE